jgi:hypothetical protein
MNVHATPKIQAEDLDRQLSNMEIEPVEAGPEFEVERSIDVHRRIILTRGKRIDATRRGLKETIASLEEDRKFEKRRHEEAMAIFAGRIAEAKDQAARDIAADRKLVAVSRDAIETLSAE